MEIAGIPVVESPYVPPPRPPTPGEDARRIVRHGLADVLEWLGEPVGPAPGEPVHTAYLINHGAADLVGAAVVVDPFAVAAIRGL